MAVMSFSSGGKNDGHSISSLCLQLIRLQQMTDQIQRTGHNRGHLRPPVVLELGERPSCICGAPELVGKLRSVKLQLLQAPAAVLWNGNDPGQIVGLQQVLQHLRGLLVCLDRQHPDLRLIGS